MKLCELLENVEHKRIGTDDKEINELTCFSKDTKEGSLIFAIKGCNYDGHDFIEEAITKGAVAVVVSRVPEHIGAMLDVATIIVVKDVRKALAMASCRFYNNPSEHMQVIGVTGTKGKTSVTFMIRHILEKAGIKTGIIGTVYIGYGDNLKPSIATTPGPIELQRTFREMADDGCKAVIMEVSSQGLMQHRTDGIDFNIGVFTNISPDHIGEGEHDNFDQYMFCKSLLFNNVKTAVINGNDRNWEKIVRNNKIKRKIFFGNQEKCECLGFDVSHLDFSYSDVKNVKRAGKLCTEFLLRAGKPYDNGTERRFLINLPGTFNVENALASIAVARALGVPWDNIESSLNDIYIPGRLEIVISNNNFIVLVDYAHNGIALKNTLNSLKEFNPNRLMVIFGCGGNRDRNRRFEMGRVAFGLADYIIVTSDNPRNENPQTIIDDITSVMTFCDKVILAIPDRKAAIERAIKEARDGDILVIAGKGHETYQIIGENIIEFDDKQVVISCGKDPE